VKDISVLGRATQGVKLIALEGDEVVVDITRLAREVPVSAAGGGNGGGGEGGADEDGDAAAGEAGAESGEGADA
jgi:hypothetical protein